MENKKIKFKFENDFECNYRYEIKEISSNVSAVLGVLGKYAKQQRPDYSAPLERIVFETDKAEKMSVPIDYKETHKLLLDGFRYFINALKLLVKIFEDPKIEPDINKIKKAATFVEVGTAYLKISSCKNFEYFEKKQSEVNNKNKV